MLFSIITICLNNRAGLQQTRHSIKQQTCRNFEWLVVDGGSHDGSVEDVRDWQHEIAGFVSEKDRGIYDAMNKGLDAAKGRYVLFMNAGDALADEQTLQKISDQIVMHPSAEFLYGDSFEKLLSGRIVLKKARHHSKWWWGMWTHHQAMIYSRAAIGGLRYDLSHPTNADYKLSMQILRTNQNVQLPFPIALCDVPGFSAQRPAFARRMQRRARRDVMKFNSLANYGVSIGQALSITIRRRLPGLFTFLRFSKT